MITIFYFMRIDIASVDVISIIADAHVAAWCEVSAMRSADARQRLRCRLFLNHRTARGFSALARARKWRAKTRADFSRMVTIGG